MSFTSVKNERVEILSWLVLPGIDLLGKDPVLTDPEILVGSRGRTPPECFSESKFNLRCRSAKNFLFSEN